MKKAIIIFPLFFINLISATYASSENKDDSPYELNQIFKIGYEKFLRLNDPQNKTKNSDWFDLSYELNAKKMSLKSHVAADFRFYINTKDFNPSLREAYIQYKDPKTSTYAIGRKKIDWHPTESFWQLNHVQNTQGFKLMDTTLEGLTGFHYSFSDHFLNIDIFLSYFTIPSLNPSVSVKGGKVKSNVDWYKLPPTKTIINTSEVDIYYNLNTPDYQDVLIQKSLGLRMGTDFQIKNTLRGQLHAFAFYKPERNLRINAEAYYDPGIDRVVINANPIVNHHMILGADLRMLSGNWNFITGLVHVDPSAKLGSDFDSLSLSREDNRSLSSKFFRIEPLYIRETYAHFQLNHHWKNLSLSLNGIYFFSKIPNGSDDFYSETVKWIRAIGLGGKYKIGNSSEITFSLRYDGKREDNLLNTQYILKPWKACLLTLGAEFIKSPQSSSYWSAYRTNDTFYFNAAYIF